MIKPEAIPQYTGDLGQLEKDHASLKADAGHIRDTGSSVHTHFQALSAYYQAPEAEQLFASTKPVKDRADGFADDLEKVASSLSDYASEIRPLVTKLTQLKTDATTFVNDNKDDDDWEYDGDKVEEHNQLRDDITATVAAFWAAERTCHNKITALFGGTQMVAGDGSDRKDQYGFNADDLKNAKLPWGDPVEEKHHWYEVGHWVKSFVWDGLIVDGIWGTIKGLGTLVGFGGWDAMGQAWKGLAQLATGLVISSIPGAGTLFWTLPDDKLPSWLRDSRTAMKETGKALVAWDEWGKNPGRAAGAVTFNVLTTVFTGGAGGAAAGAGKAGAVAKVLSVAGKAGKVIDPMTYIAKGAGAGLSKIGDITKGLKGISNIDIPKLPDDAITIPEGSLKLPDGTFHLPEGAPVPEGGVKLPDGNVKFPDDVPVLPENTTKLPTHTDAPVQYFDHDGNLLDEHGDIVQKAEDAPKEPSPTVPHTDGPDPTTPHTNTPDPTTPHPNDPVREPALVGVGANAGDNVVHLGSDLGDTGRLADDLPTTHNPADNLPGGHAGDNLPGGNAGNHLPHAGAADHLPGGHADDLGHGPTAGHEPPNTHTGGHGDGPQGPHDPTPPHHNDHTPNSHADDAAHHGKDEGTPHHGSDDTLPHDDGIPHDDGVPHDPDGPHGPDGPDHPGGDGPGNEPHGKPVEPQPSWHGQSADKMRHYRRPALDVSHLPLKDQLPLLEREASALADDALKAPAGAAPPGLNHLESGCAGSFLHDNTITAHSSTTKMHGQKLPKRHAVLDDILKNVEKTLEAEGKNKGIGHGKCAEISLISDRLHQIDPTGKSIRTIDDAKAALEGGVMHSRQIGDLRDRVTGELDRVHNEFLPPCRTCEHVLPQLGIRVHS
ncbi:YwqJ-related putative deaminase [Streptomyces sp. NBC_00825]|uniref:YwqJ-related putative deaminase n=1 Tax=unclassified Streptomyces TaxID=2593676 RepID=UPI002ED24D15|nr:YwqJ-related putative deaminase [Streptomyces sp. NBC_00826]WTH90190.1 YwqJ-related putative deaminase [Streptomyces sp. NBC_00825]WTH98918.1 YwqJ-related putative deaminase [Streptomyces sp. NBC_00822]